MGGSLFLFQKGEHILFFQGDNPLPPRLPEFLTLTLHLDNYFSTKISYGGTDAVAGRRDTVDDRHDAISSRLNAFSSRLDAVSSRPDVIGNRLNAVGSSRHFPQALGHTLGCFHGRKPVELSGMAS